MTDREGDETEMREEYDFSRGVRNPYVQQFRELNLVSLDPDVQAAFPDSAAVNQALRLLMETSVKVSRLPKAS